MSGWDDRLREHVMWHRTSDGDYVNLARMDMLRASLVKSQSQPLYYWAIEVGQSGVYLDEIYVSKEAAQEEMRLITLTMDGMPISRQAPNTTWLQTPEVQ